MPHGWHGAYIHFRVVPQLLIKRFHAKNPASLGEPA